jgi:hypothetical protein
MDGSKPNSREDLATPHAIRSGKIWRAWVSPKIAHGRIMCAIAFLQEDSSDEISRALQEFVKSV